ncbi:cytochrome P450 [Streptomyces sp. P38-E01]|uniref:Cytochrome P450 n=1 Tax=Streptomyces tardus TaxID=2780544 RepID=A0A949N1A7_9ACTN|nr:cytochrome P450 [Streptomyces tardus]MBU7597590.1 cytochrome P450 [Streptomyces tardus]
MSYHALEPVPLYGPDFAADPHAVYAKLRQGGPVAKVEIAPGLPAFLVLSYQAALDLLRDTDTWSKNPSVWQETVPKDSPILPMLQYRPNVLFNDGAEHARLRSVITDSFSLIEPHDLRRRTIEASDMLLRNFAERGTVDLVTEYARPLPLVLFNALFGMPDHHSPQLIRTIAGMMEATEPDEAIAAGAEFEQYVLELVTLKSEKRGPDLTSWFMDHPAGLSLEEVIHQIVLTMAAGHEPTTNLTSNALSRMLSNPDYYSTLSGGALTPRDAVNDVLRNEPPMANYSAHYPRHNVRFHGTWIHANQLVLVSYAAANTEPQTGTGLPGAAALGGPHEPAGMRTGAAPSDGGSHLAWSAGPHACPVKQPALLIAVTAIERLANQLCDIQLTVPRAELEWRAGPFHRALAHLPASFTPLTPDQAGVTPWTSSSRTRRHATSPATAGPA